MATSYSTSPKGGIQAASWPSALKAMLDSIDASTLIEKLLAYRWNGRPGHSRRALWRAHLLCHFLNLPSISALVRALQDDPRLKRICGFGQLPHRSTFSRFFSRVNQHHDLVEKAMASMTDQLAELLPGFGEQVAVDSTNVSTHSNPRRPTISDPEASWTAKTKDATKGEKEWHFGYK